MNLKKAKALRKEMRLHFGNPTTEKRVYQAVNQRMVPVFDDKGKIVYEENDGLAKKKMKTQIVPGTLKATGLRRLYQDTKVTVGQDR